MIPKIIHYCWFGRGDYDDRMTACIDSWSRVCPDYQIMRWDEESFDFGDCLYATQAYEKGRYAFVSDYVRFKVLKKYGGFYFDTDIELLKPLDTMLDKDAVFSFKQKFGNMKHNGITSGIMGCAKDTSLFDPLIAQIENRSYVFAEGKEDFTPVAKYLTDMLTEQGFLQDNSLQQIGGVCVFPNDYLCPTIDIEGTGHIDITDNTHAIHYFTGSWRTPEITEMLRNRIKNAKDGENVV